MSVDIRNLDEEVKLDIDQVSDEELEKGLKGEEHKEVEEEDEINKEEEKQEEEQEVPAEPEKGENEADNEETREEIDYKEKFVASQKEALRLAEINKKLSAEKEEIVTRPKLTDEDLANKYPDWEYYSDHERTLIRKTEEQERRLEALEARNQMFLNEKKFSKEIDDQLGVWDATGEYKAVVKNQDDFKKFAKKDGNKGLSMDVLAKLFIYELPKKVQPKGSTPMSASSVKHTEKGLNENKMTLEDVAHLRKTKPMEYMQRAANGEFDNVF